MRGRTVAAESVIQRVWRRARWFIRDRFPDREVVREVQGVRMHLPWSHRLPDYAGLAPDYGQNLIRLAELIAVDEAPLTVLDVGANVGDSTLQILRTVDARVLCVEADGFFVDFLKRNVGDDKRVTIEAKLLSAARDSVAMAPVRVGGTTRFEPGTSDVTAPTVTTEALRDQHAEFTDLRLAKSDTDGYDVELIPAIARTWAHSRPVLFLEYDHALSRLAGNDPLALWPELAELGYTRVAAWDNSGQPVGQWDVSEIASQTGDLDTPDGDVVHRYWDVAVAHGADPIGLAALEQLVPSA